MGSDSTVADKRKLVDLARAIVERAQQASAASQSALPEADKEALHSLELHDELSLQAVAEFATRSRQQIETVDRQATTQLDAMMLVLERFEIELTALRGEVDGLRAEQQQFIKRVSDAEEAVRSGADELVAQVSER